MIHKAFMQNGSDTIARIVFTLPESTWADQIHLVGDFNSWNTTSHPFQRDRSGTWYLSLDLPIGRSFKFRYLMDQQQWANDQGADLYEPAPSGPHSFVIVTDPSFRRRGRAWPLPDRAQQTPPSAPLVVWMLMEQLPALMSLV